MPLRKSWLWFSTAGALVLAGAALMARPRSGDPLARIASVCASQDVSLQGEPHRVLAVCTRSARETPLDEPGHIDLYLLKHDDDGWRPVAQRLGLESGRFGQPGEVVIHRLGRELYGFELNDTSVSQGYLLGNSRLYVPRGAGFQLALDFTSGVQNSGTHECASDTPAACSDLARRMKVQPQDDGPAYRLSITSAGRYRGQPVSSTHVLSYDANRHQYRLPAGFEPHIE